MLVELLFSFFLTLFGLFLLLRTRLRYLAVDRPNHRSLHTDIVPRTGGLAIMAGGLVSWLFLGVDGIWLLLVLVLLSVSLVDDVRGMRVRWRLLAQFAVCAAFLLLYLGGLLWWVLLLLLFAMVWMVNLYNFMDGSDGLAGGMALFGFAAYALAALQAGYQDLAALCAVLASANLAFLLFNFHPARIFMGDAGSISLGFLAASIGLWGWRQELWPCWFPVLVFSPFIVDATLTLLRRLLRGERVWLAHKSHYYQKLVQLGWGHRKTALMEYLLMLLVAGSAVLLLRYSLFWQLLVLAFWGLCYVVLVVLIELAWSDRKAD